jgi:hypothetical protein
MRQLIGQLSHRLGAEAVLALQRPEVLGNLT